MSKKISTISGQVYVVTMSTAGVITGTGAEGSEIVLASAEAGQQVTFQAISQETTSSDDGAIVLPFREAPLPLVVSGATGEQVADMVEGAVMSYKREVVESEAGVDNLTPHYVTLAAERVPVGRLRKLTLMCRSDHAEYLAEAVFLTLDEQDEGGDWVRVGVSVAAVQQVIGSEQTWVFDGVKLHGRAIRLQPVYDRGAAFNAQSSVVLGLRVFATTDGSMCDALKYAPQYKIEVDKAVDKFATVEHLEDEELHLREGERDKWDKAVDGLKKHEEDAQAHLDAQQKAAVARLVEAEPAVQQVGESKLVNEATGAYMRLGGAFVGLDAGEKYQAAMASLDKEHGAGVRILVSREKAYYKHGAGDELADGDELVRKEELEAAALTDEQKQALEFILTNKDALQALLEAQG